MKITRRRSACNSGKWRVGGVYCILSILTSDHKKPVAGRSSSDITKDALYVSQREYYRRTYENADTIPWDDAFDVEWLKRTLKKIGRPEGRTALEIGTGHGKGARILTEAGYIVAGIDYLLDPLQEAAKKNNEAGRAPFYIQADVFKPPFAGKMFDLVLDWGVFHHIRRADTKTFLDSIIRLLKVEGRFLLGCFSTKFRHNGEKNRKRNWTLHRGHYDRFSKKKELKKVFSPSFTINSFAENGQGLYLIDMTMRG